MDDESNAVVLINNGVEEVSERDMLSIRDIRLVVIVFYVIQQFPASLDSFMLMLRNWKAWNSLMKTGDGLEFISVDA